MAAVVDVAVFLTFAPLSYPPHFLDGGDGSLAFYEGFRQVGKALSLLMVRMFLVHTRKS